MNNFRVFRVKNHDFTPINLIFFNCEGSCENCLGISCEKSRFYGKKIIFFPTAEGGAKIVWVFRVKNHDSTPKNHIFFPILGGGAPLDMMIKS